MKHIPYFDDFLRDEVNLNQNRLDRLKNSSSAIDSYLDENLKSYRKSERQGSFATGTIIKPVNNHEYDADKLVFLTYDKNKEPKEYIEDIYNCLRESNTYRDKVHRKTHCVVVDYTGDFHLDLVPCVEINGLTYVCNRKSNQFERTDGNGYRDWFVEKSRKTNGHLKRVVRLLKYVRDIKETFSIPSIILTTLAGQEVLDWDNDSCYSNVPSALKTISNRINSFLRNHPDLPYIGNPALASENLAMNWSEDQYSNFRDKFDLYNNKINDAYGETDHDSSVKKWRAVFGDKFGKLNNSNLNSIAISSPGLVTSVTPRKQHAGVQEIRDVITITSDQVLRLRTFFPDLKYESESNKLFGQIDFCAYYDSNTKKLEIGNQKEARNHSLFICDRFKVEICFNSVDVNGWPTVYETGGRHHEIASRYSLRIVDLHFYPNSDACCLGIKRSVRRFRFDTIQFIAELVIPFLYRLSYVDRFGLAAARADLWGEYSHKDGYQEYVNDLLTIAETKPQRNSKCPCGSGKKYKHCHMDEVVKMFASNQHCYN